MEKQGCVQTQEAEAGGLQVQGQPGLHREFQDNVVYMARPCILEGEREREEEGEGGEKQALLKAHGRQLFSAVHPLLRTPHPRMDKSSIF